MEPSASSPRRHLVLWLLGVVVLILVFTALCWHAPRSPEEALRRWQPVPPARADTTPAPVPLTDRIRETQAFLESIIQEYAGDEKLPWGIAHGLIADGKDFCTRDGVSGIDFLYAEVAHPLEIGRRPYPYPGFSHDRFTEPHVDLMLKAVVESGVAPEHPIEGAFGKGTVADHMRGVMLKFDFDPTTGPTSIRHPDDLPWTLQGLATWLRPEAATWRNLAGHTIDLNQVTDWAVDRLEQETARLREIRTTGGKLRKDAKHIMRFTCGGAHLFQGVSYAVGRGFGSPRCREVLREQTELLLWRREAELLAYREALRERPDLEVTMLVQQAKFLGHWNESVHKALILGLDQPDEAARAGLERGLQQLVETVRLLQAAGAYQRMDRLRLSPGQDLNIYLDLVGDSCHALRGLRLATAQDTLRW